MQSIVNPDGQKKNGDGIHGSVERHVHASKLQPARQSIRGGNGNDRQEQDVGRFPHASEIKPQDDAQQEHGCAGEHADFFPDGGAGIFSKLCKGEGSDIGVVGGSGNIGFHGFGPHGDVGLNITKNLVAVIERFA